MQASSEGGGSVTAVALFVAITFVARNEELNLHGLRNRNPLKFEVQHWFNILVIEKLFALYFPNPWRRLFYKTTAAVSSQNHTA